MKYQGFVGPSYVAKSVNVDCQRCVNLYPELAESGTAKEGTVAYLTTTPGLESALEVGVGPIRMIFADRPPQNSYIPNNRIFIASGSELFRASYISGAWDVDKVGDLYTSSGPVYCDSKTIFDADNGRPIGNQLLFVDGKGIYSYAIIYDPDNPLAPPTEDWDPLSDGSETAIEDGMPVPTHLAWIDGFVILNDKGTDKFRVSGYNNFIFDPLDYASSEGDPDVIMALLAMNRDLWIFNERSIEIWSNTGDSFPFRRIEGGFIDKGCVAPYSVAKVNGFAFWIGRDEFGQGIVYAAQGVTPQRISTHAVEHAIKGYSDISAATAYTYQSEGNFFYVLNFAEGTWVYDLSTKMWHERAYTNDDGELERHRADNLCFVPKLNLHLVGDYESGKVYALKSDVYTDDGQAITRMRVAPHVSNSGKRVFYHSLTLDMETGVGLDGDVQGSNPQAMLDWSNDGGHTWSNEIWGSIGEATGQIGQFKKRVVFNRLGSARDRVFRLKITDPVKVNIIGAYLDLEAGAA